MGSKGEIVLTMQLDRVRGAIKSLKSISRKCSLRHIFSPSIFMFGFFFFFNEYILTKKYKIHIYIYIVPMEEILSISSKRSATSFTARKIGFKF